MQQNDHPMHINLITPSQHDSLVELLR